MAGPGWHAPSRRLSSARNAATSTWPAASSRTTTPPAPASASVADSSSSADSRWTVPTVGEPFSAADSRATATVRSAAADSRTPSPSGTAADGIAEAEETRETCRTPCRRIRAGAALASDRLPGSECPATDSARSRASIPSRRSTGSAERARTVLLAARPRRTPRTEPVSCSGRPRRSTKSARVSGGYRSCPAFRPGEEG